jgi:hypothetical protein
MSNFQNPKVPPTGGSHLPHAHPDYANPARNRGTCRAKARCIGRCAALIPPEIAEPVGRKLGVSDGVLDILVAEIVLQGSGIVPVVGKFIAARMPQHVRMQWERHPGGLAEPLDEMMEADGAHGSAALGDKNVSLGRILMLELA